RFASWLKQGKEELFKERQKREKPALDDKSILSWNALALAGICDAGRFLGKKAYVDLAKELANAIETHFKAEGGYFRIFKNGKRSIPAFLEDIATLCQAYLALYQTSFEEEWLFKARDLADLVIADFADEETGLFYFVSSHAEKLVVRKKDLGDDVIPSANAQMVINFYLLHAYFGESDYK